MYQILHEPFGPISQVKLINTDTGEWFSFIPALAASLNGLALRKKDQVHMLIEGCSTYENLMHEGREKFMGSKLFPFPNRIKDGTYHYNENSFQLEKNFSAESHAIHGLVLNTAFEITSEKASSESATVSLKYEYKGSDQGYPYHYTLTIDFILNKSGFTCTTGVENKDVQPIPLGDGWHPYLKLNCLLDTLSLKIPSRQVVELDDRLIPTGKLLYDDRFETIANIGTTTFDTCYKLTEEEDIAETELYDPAKDLRLKLWQKTGKNKYNYLQIYTPPSRSCIAIEPMTCMPDAFNNKNGLILLSPGKFVNFTFGIQLR
jgi:aldose 1-epimerase